MKTKKITFIIEQVFFIVLVNYLLLFDDGLIFKRALQPDLIFALAFFHLGTFSSLYASIRSKNFSVEKENILFQLNMVFYLGFVSLLLFQKCSYESDSLAVYYGIALYLLLNTTLFLFAAGRSYKKYQLTHLSTNLK